MNSKNNISVLRKITLYALLLLACFNFMGRGPVFYMIFSFFAVIMSRKLYWNNICTQYLLLSLFAIISSIIFFKVEDVSKSLVFFLSFYAGYCICRSFSSDKDFINGLIISGVLGFFANLVFTAYINFQVVGHVDGERLLISPWTNDYISVTLVGLMSIVPIVYSSYCLLFRKENYVKIIGALILVVSLWINMTTATRTPFLLAGIVYVFMLYKLFISMGTKRRMLLIPFLLVFGFLFINILFPSVSDSAIVERFTDEGVQTSRWDIMNYYFEQMPKYPLGGGFAHRHYDRLPHNIIQETYDLYGVFFFVVFIIVLIGMFGRVLKLNKTKNKSSFSYLLLGLFVGVGIQIMLEPVVTGYPQLVWFLFFIDGVVVAAMADKNKSLLQKII